MADEKELQEASADQVAPAEHTRSGRYYRPAVDILETADELTVVADVPGAKPESIDVRFEDGALSIHAQVPPRRDEDAEYILHEYGVGDFWRTFRVSESIDAAKITAEYADGVLTLHLPKAEAVKPRRITVKG